jgi:hypothetical protein
MNIKINIGGQLFETTFDTIIKIPYFRDMFEACGEAPNETLFVNRPPHIFKHILAFIIDPLYPFPKKYAFELDFYGIDYKNINLYDMQQEITGEIKNQTELLCQQQVTTNEQTQQNLVGLNNKIKHITETVNKIITDPRRACPIGMSPTGDTRKCRYTTCGNTIDYNKNYCNRCEYWGSCCNSGGCNNNRTRGGYCHSHQPNQQL